MTYHSLDWSTFLEMPELFVDKLNDIVNFCVEEAFDVLPSIKVSPHSFRRTGCCKGKAR